MHGHWAGVKKLLDNDIFPVDNGQPHSYIFDFEQEKRHNLSLIKKSIYRARRTIKKTRRKSR